MGNLGNVLNVAKSGIDTIGNLEKALKDGKIKNESDLIKLVGDVNKDGKADMKDVEEAFLKAQDEAKDSGKEDNFKNILGSIVSFASGSSPVASLLGSLISGDGLKDVFGSLADSLLGGFGKLFGGGDEDGGGILGGIGKALGF